MFKARFSQSHTEQFRFASSEPMKARFGIWYAEPELQEKSVSPSESVQEVEPDDGVYGMSKVTVGAVDSEYVGSDVPRKASSDLQASGATVTAPSGYYESAASKTVASGSATTPSTSKSVTPQITVSSAGLVTASVQNESVSVTPTVVPGYVSSGTAGAVSISGSNEHQLDTQAGATITPSASEQIAVAAQKFTTGNIIVNPIPSEYIIPSGTKPITANGTHDVAAFANASVAIPYVPFGEEATLIQTYDMGSKALSATGFHGWTPSTTATTIRASYNLGTIKNPALDEYEYLILTLFESNTAYASGTTLKGAVIRQIIELAQVVHRKPSNFTNLASATDNYNYCSTLFTASLMDYYKTDGTHALTWTGSYGFYPNATAATFGSTTGENTTITVKAPSWYSRCSTSYFTTTMAAAVDEANSTVKSKVYVYRMKKGSLMYKMFHDVVGAYNE